MSSPHGSPTMTPRALQLGTPIPINPDAVRECLDPLERPGDGLFLRAWTDGIDAIPLAERRGALSWTTGHVAESVVAVLLAELGYSLVWQLADRDSMGLTSSYFAPTARVFSSSRLREPCGLASAPDSAAGTCGRSRAPGSTKMTTPA